jgi:hypothetical protein
VLGSSSGDRVNADEIKHPGLQWRGGEKMTLNDVQRLFMVRLQS